MTDTNQKKKDNSTNSDQQSNTQTTND